MVDRMVATGLRVADDSGRDETAPLTPMMISVHITGDDIYETLRMPVVPRKGDILSLSSLTLGRSPVLEAVVSKVEWARNQTAAFGENDGIHAWLSVRRTSHSVAFEREQKAKAKAKP